MFILYFLFLFKYIFILCSCGELAVCQDKQLDYLREELVEQAVVRGDMGRELQEVVDKEQHHQEQTVKALKDIQTSSLAMEHSHRKVEAAYNRDRWGRR